MRSLTEHSVNRTHSECAASDAHTAKTAGYSPHTWTHVDRYACACAPSTLWKAKIYIHKRSRQTGDCSYDCVREILGCFESLGFCWRYSRRPARRRCGNACGCSESAGTWNCAGTRCTWTGVLACGWQSNIKHDVLCCCGGSACCRWDRRAAVCCCHCYLLLCQDCRSDAPMCFRNCQSWLLKLRL